MQNAMALFAASGLNVSSVTMVRHVNASKVSWVILSLVDNACRMFAHLKSHASSQACASADVARDVARGWFAASEPCAILQRINACATLILSAIPICSVCHVSVICACSEIYTVSRMFLYKKKRKIIFNNLQVIK